MRRLPLAGILAAFTGSAPDTRGNHRSYYHPGESPRSRNHGATPTYVRKQDGSRAGFRLMEKAEAKHQRRAARGRG